MTSAGHDLFHRADHALERLHLTHDYRDIDSRDPVLRCSLPVPRGWHSATIARPWGASPASVEVLGAFAGSMNDHGPRLLIGAKRMGYDVDLLDWLSYRWRWCDWTIFARRAFGDRFKGRVEICGFRSERSSLQIRRSTARGHGPYLLFVDTFAPHDAWPHLHDILWPCGPCLTLEDQDTRPLLERRRRHTAGPLSFELPASWRGTRDANGWMFDMQDGRFGALVGIAVSPAPLDPMPSSPLLNPLASRGFEVVTLSDSVTLGERKWTRGLCHRAPLLCELTIVQRKLGNARIDQMIVLPPAARYPGDAMRASRAFAIMQDTLRLDDEIAATERFRSTISVRGLAEERCLPVDAAF